jgi:hypothetical protein
MIGRFDGQHFPVQFSMQGSSSGCCCVRGPELCLRPEGDGSRSWISALTASHLGSYEILSGRVTSWTKNNHRRKAKLALPDLPYLLPFQSAHVDGQPKIF